MELDVRLWDSELASELWDDDLYLRVDRRASIDRGPTEIHVSLLRPNGRDEAPIGDLHVDFLASDGLRTETLLRGDVGQRSDTAQTVNITRVTPPVPPDFNARLPWRMNAYARMPLAKFASAETLASYVELLDPRRQGARGAADAASVGFLGATRRSSYRVLRDEVVHGDDVDLVLDEGAFGGRGATWLVGELVARAIAERAEALRFARVRWVRRDGTRVADYGRRTGERLPPPFG
jgi:type VI protein secretion system component VasA